MALEDLKKLKNRLLNQKKYFVADLDSLYRGKDVDHLYTAEEIIRLENSKEISEGCNKLLEELTYYLVSNFGNVNQIALDSITLPLISKSILDDEDISLDSRNKSDYDKIAKYFMENYAYVCFGISDFNTVINGYELCDMADTEKFNKMSGNIKEIVLKHNISGFINYDKFVRNIQSLGYKICFYSKNPASTFKDYKNNYFDLCSLDIIANLEDKKVKTKK